MVGTIKGLSDKYGIADILRAVAEVRNKGAIPILLRIAGRGPQEMEFREMAVNLGIDDITTWMGFISQEEAAREWSNMDVAIIPSTLDSESFGVSAVEAQASGTPVIISDVPGLLEATNGGRFCEVVPKNDAQAIAKAIINLYKNSEIRRKMGGEGRKYCLQNYNIDTCFMQIQELFEQYIKLDNPLNTKPWKRRSLH